MKNLIKGDKVYVLDDDIEGVVIVVKNDQIVIETTDGFNMTFHESELLKMSDQGINLKIGFGEIDQVIKEKELPKRKTFVKEKKSRRETAVPEFDLHIEKLVKNYKGMNNFDILTLQMETAQRHIEFAIKNKIPKIVFIHGVGEGVLKAELDFLLGRYENVVFQDANYQKYGLGATEIYFKQNK